VEKLKTVKIVALVLVALAAAAFLHKNLPRTAVVQITGTDVKRVDLSGNKAQKVQQAGKDATTGLTSDVRYINTLTRTGKTKVFRNEDTGWGWPPYFKFDAADLTAQAQAFASAEEKPWVLVKYYGWRIHIFSMFPNAVSMKAVDRDYAYLPLFNIVFFIVLIVAGYFIRRKYRQFTAWIRGRKNPPPDNTPENAQG
jgi:hypothetical protein